MKEKKYLDKIVKILLGILTESIFVIFLISFCVLISIVIGSVSHYAF